MSTQPLQRSPIHMAIGAALLMTVSFAHAQSGYTMTVLNKPSGAYRYYPTALLNNDVVKGGMSYWYAYDWNIGYYCTPCSTYLDRESTWPASTASAVGATLGRKGFFPLLANDAGQQVGAYTLNASSNRDAMQPSALWATRANQVTGRRGSHFLANASSTPVSLVGPGGLSQEQAYGINDLGWLVGSKDPGGYLYRNGAFEAVPLPYPRALNRQGDAVGIQVVVDNPQLPVEEQTWARLPAIWRSSQTLQVGGSELQNHEPVDINVSGQVLLQEVQPDHPNHHTRAAVWNGQTTTPIAGPAGLFVQAVDINDSGTVVGCLQKNAVLSLSNYTPFIWKNGVLQDLGALLTSKGIKLPTGMKWGCPTAINNKGSMLMYYFKVGNETSVTWVRLTAKP